MPLKKSRIRETLNLSTDADTITISMTFFYIFLFFNGDEFFLDALASLDLMIETHSIVDWKLTVPQIPQIQG